MGGYPHIQPFFTNFSNSKNFYKCFDLSGGQKCPNNGLVSLKKYVVFSLDWEGGGQMQCNKCYIFFSLTLTITIAVSQVPTYIITQVFRNLLHSKLSNPSPQSQKTIYIFNSRSHFLLITLSLITPYYCSCCPPGKILHRA